MQGSLTDGMDVHGFNIVFRPEWGAKPCKGYVEPRAPMEYLVLYFNTETPKCDNKKDCCNIINEMQTFHQKKGLADLHYNYLIGGDGNVYEGRGFKREPSKCVLNHDYDSKNFAIAYIGDWSKDLVIPESMQKAFSLLADLLVERTVVKETYTLISEKEKIPLVKIRKPRKTPDRIRLTFDGKGKYKW